MRVIIIGAGLGGLTLAQGLLAEGIDFDLYERDGDAEARFQGYRIGLGDEGLEGLRSCLPTRLHPLLEAISGEVSGDGRRVDIHLNELGRQAAQYEGKMFDRHVLRHLLLAGLGDRVHFGKQLTAYEVLPDGTVLARFIDGTSSTADLMVGADGMGSTVRRQLVPGVEPIDLGIHGGIGRTPLTDQMLALVPGWSTMVQGTDVQLYLGKMVFQQDPAIAAAELAPDVYLPSARSYLRWVLLVPPGAQYEFPSIEADPTVAVKILLDVMKDWHPDLRAVLEQADPRNSGIGPLKDAGPVAPWQTGPVTLLGDAAHPLPPGGNGATLALQDAAQLRDKLLAPDLFPAVADYERALRARAAEARGDADVAIDRINGES